MFATYPVLLLGAFVMIKAIMNRTIQGFMNYAKAGGIAEEILYSIKTIISFANYKHEKERFGKGINEALSNGLESAKKNGMGMGFLFFIIFGAYALAIWYGGTLLVANLNNILNNKLSDLDRNAISQKAIGPGIL